jgi:hypothetical protein
MFGKISIAGIAAFFVIALIGASITSTPVLNTQQVVAKSSGGIGEMIKNMSKMGVVITSTPIMCTSMGDVMKALMGQLSGGGNLANMTGSNNSSGGMMSMMNETGQTGLMEMMKNQSGGMNQTGDMQGMLTNLINQTMASGTENMTDDLGKVKDLMLCSPTSEKKLEKMLK